ncbi:hypothetical protein Csa_017344 [Cucumis sativus]|uniref:Uncharacterized protein n=1 Tax=Cucumis sativus TaxID=3659 RepID=A0A0A0K2I8_CUCSA|nr:hypothetical protein Csa_017344 [Cucumis sativus]
MNFLIHVRLGSCHQLPSEIVYFRAVEQQFSSINGDGQADDAPGSLYRSVNGEDLKNHRKVETHMGEVICSRHGEPYPNGRSSYIYRKLFGQWLQRS